MRLRGLAAVGIGVWVFNDFDRALKKWGCIRGKAGIGGRVLSGHRRLFWRCDRKIRVQEWQLS